MRAIFEPNFPRLIDTVGDVGDHAAADAARGAQGELRLARPTGWDADGAKVGKAGPVAGAASTDQSTVYGQLEEGSVREIGSFDRES